MKYIKKWKKKNQTKNKKTYCDLGQSCYALKSDEPMFVFAAEHKTVKLPQTTHFLALFFVHKFFPSSKCFLPQMDPNTKLIALWKCKKYCCNHKQKNCNTFLKLNHKYLTPPLSWLSFFYPKQSQKPENTHYRTDIYILESLIKLINVLFPAKERGIDSNIYIRFSASTD